MPAAAHVILNRAIYEEGGLAGWRAGGEMSCTKGLHSLQRYQYDFIGESATLLFAPNLQSRAL